MKAIKKPLEIVGGGTKSHLWKGGCYLVKVVPFTEREVKA